MRIDTSRVQFRAQASRLARTESISADAAAARASSVPSSVAEESTPESAEPGHLRDFGPWTRSLRALDHPTRFDSLQPRERARPTFDLAAYLARRCVQAYPQGKPPYAGFATALAEESGLADVQLFSSGTDFAFGYRRGDTLVIAFRGTRFQSLQQWTLTNFRAFPARRPMRHVGFQLAWERLSRDIYEWIERVRPREGDIMLTGHSLGGAIAILAAFELAERYPIRAVVTIGAPRVGFPGFRDAYLCRRVQPARFGATDRTLGAITRRITHADDFVSRVPPDFIFRHVGEEARLDATGKLTEGESRSVLTRLYSTVDRGVGACYEAIDGAMHPSAAATPEWVKPVVAAKVEPGAPPFRTVHLDAKALARLDPSLGPPPKGLRRVWKDVVAVNQKIPLTAFVSYTALQWLLIGIGGLIGIVATLLVLVDFSSHRSRLYLDAFRKRYPLRDPALALPPDFATKLAESPLASIYGASATTFNLDLPPAGSLAAAALAYEKRRAEEAKAPPPAPQSEA